MMKEIYKYKMYELILYNISLILLKNRDILLICYLQQVTIYLIYRQLN